MTAMSMSHNQDEEDMINRGMADGPRMRLLWAFGFLVAFAVLGPALRLGPMFSLDLVVPPRLPIPPGVWGLGPELPRRVPLGLGVAWLSHLVGGPTAMVALLALSIAGAFAGAARLAARGGASLGGQTVAGLIYASSPFLLTRVGAGQWGLVAAVGALPWALPPLLRPSHHRLAHVFGAAALLGATGFAGGALAALTVMVGLVGDRLRRAPQVVAVVVLGQLPWAVPGVIVALSASGHASSSAFATRVSGAPALFELAAGRGFWRATSQVGVGGWPAAAVGVALLGLAAAGAMRMAAPWRSRALGLAALGAVVSLASAVPGINGVADRITGTTLGAGLRDGQRAAALFLVVLASLAGLGVDAVAAHARKRLPVGDVLPALATGGLVLALAGPALWGVGGRLQPRRVPAAYAVARRAIAARPGTVLALPWHQYLDLSYAGGRRVLNPLPDYLGGDVLVSSDPEVPGSSEEAADPRARPIRELLPNLERGEASASDLTRLGVRWVVLLEAADVARYAGLDRVAGLTRVTTGPGLRLYRLDAWRGPAVDDAGLAVGVTGSFAPWRHVGRDEPARWYRPGQAGWLRGWRAARVNELGTIDLPAGSGPLWYWPALLVLFADTVTVAAVAAAVRSLFSHPPSDTVR